MLNLTEEQLFYGQKLYKGVAYQKYENVEFKYYTPNTTNEWDGCYFALDMISAAKGGGYDNLKNNVIWEIEITNTLTVYKFRDEYLCSSTLSGDKKAGEVKNTLECLDNMKLSEWLTTEKAAYMGSNADIDDMEVMIPWGIIKDYIIVKNAFIYGHKYLSNSDTNDLKKLDI